MSVLFSLSFPWENLSKNRMTLTKYFWIFLTNYQIIRWLVSNPVEPRRSP